MNIISQLNIKPFYRVTGTPENFLTALRFSVWGFNNEKSWNSLEPGDIVFFHSKGSDSKFLKSPKPCIVGFGVVGDNFYVDSKSLWIDEYEDGKSYPYRFSFTEIYLFSQIPINNDWDSTSLKFKENTTHILNKLLEAAIPLNELSGFPIMGSYSSIQNVDVKKALLDSSKELQFYKNKAYPEVFTKSTQLKEMKTEYETLRYATSLSVFNDIHKKVINKTDVNVTYSLDKLAEAEISHYDIVTYLRSTLMDKGYKVFYNNHIDLFAYDKEQSLLIEAKSIVNENFKWQSRKGIIQLFEYNYFEINKFKRENLLSFNKELKVLATSDAPKDSEYVKFINSLDVKTIAIKNKSIIHYGESIQMIDL
jgi:hypothetical protein